MNRSHFAAAALIVALSALSASAWTIVDGTLRSDASPTPTAPGFVTYTLTATSDAGNIIGFNFDNPFGITAEGGAQFRQVNPFGFPSIFNDLPPALFTGAGSHIQADTHFLVRSADGIAVNAADSATALRGAYNLTNAAAATPSMPFAQIVFPDSLPLRDGARIFGQFTVQTPTGLILETVSIGRIPEPASFVLAGLGVLAAVPLRRAQKTGRI